MTDFRPDHLLVRSVDVYLHISCSYVLCVAVLVVLRDYVTAMDHMQYSQLPQDIVAVTVTRKITICFFTFFTSQFHMLL